MKMKILSAIAAISIILSGCSQDLLSEAGKKLAYPVTASPTVKSFNVERGIVIQWDRDDACDEYLLYKDDLANGGFSKLIYQGTGLSYVDYDITTLGTLSNYYKLSKKTGKKQFDKSAYSFGVADSFVNDPYEYNDDRDHAANLVKNTVANIYYYKDAYGNEVEDIDWYKITLDPGFYAQLEFHNFNNIGSQQIRYAQEGCNFSPVTDGDNFTIYNYSSGIKTFYFQVYTNKTVFGNKMGDYTITIVVTQKI
jgi:hypothetical protein